MKNYRVPDMSCNHCVSTITNAVKGVDPSASITADLDTGLVSIDSGEDARTLQQAMESAGYESEIQKT